METNLRRRLFGLSTCVRTPSRIFLTTMEKYASFSGVVSLGFRHASTTLDQTIWYCCYYHERYYNCYFETTPSSVPCLLQCHPIRGLVKSKQQQQQLHVVGSRVSSCCSQSCNFFDSPSTTIVSLDKSNCYYFFFDYPYVCCWVVVGVSSQGRSVRT